MVHMSYTGTAVGMDVMKLQAAFSMDRAGYSIHIASRTVGLLSAIVRSDQHTTVWGAWRNGLPDPQRFWSWGDLRGERRETLIDYENGSPAVRSGVGSLGRAAAATGHCSHSLRARRSEGVEGQPSSAATTSPSPSASASPVSPLGCCWRCTAASKPATATARLRLISYTEGVASAACSAVSTALQWLRHEARRAAR